MVDAVVGTIDPVAARICFGCGINVRVLKL